ncbi:unnamed protein product [Spirodela intermedia]|uniref:Uncharacterized protein n=1 Tax=Spirodela intermedia TaxID=51605 RepID=A0A7I8IZS0_SPIIN|nr:unnamed protein product [Spirodela intermedia]CAA6663465.1 unnamed protein product [Spirodela intermedia]
MASEGLRGNPRRVLVGGRPYEVVVTNKYREAEEWAREILRLPREGSRIVGFSFFGRIAECIHFACFSRALVYHLVSSEESTISPGMLFSILHDGSSLFIGEDIIFGMELLGWKPSPRSLPRWSLTTVRRPLHVALAEALLDDVEVSLLRTEGLPVRWAWPLGDSQVQAAAEKVIVAEKIGKHVVADSVVVRCERQRIRRSVIRSTRRPLPHFLAH